MSELFAYLQTEQQIVQYLASGVFKGIGQKTAELLVKKFGLATLNVLELSRDKLYEVKELNSWRVEVILEAWSNAMAQPQKEALSLMLGKGITLKTALKIYECYNNKTIDVLKSNPYQLCEDIDGIGFDTADAIAMSLGLSMSSEFRYAAGLTHALESATSEGHCYLPTNALMATAEKLLGKGGHQCQQVKLQKVLSQLVLAGKLIEGKLPETIYLPGFYRTEIKVAQNIKWMTAAAEEPVISSFKWDYFLTDEQLKAVENVQRHQISLLCGGAGTGKTYTIQAALTMFRATNKTVALAAPTGKAAKRMSVMSGGAAKTIHRLLEWSQQSHAFTRNEDNPLDEDVVVVDETSMVDIFLFNSLLKALRQNTKLLLVGDFYQLPSVSPGAVLRDLVQSRTIPITQLTQIKRQAGNSKIILAAHDIKTGVMPKLTPLTNDLLTSDCFWTTANNPETATKMCLELIRSLIDKLDDVRYEVQVLCPQNKGVGGTIELNKLLQAEINPGDKTKAEVAIGHVIFRVGDKVMQTVNDYDLNVMNGEEGIIESIELTPLVLNIRVDGRIIQYNSTQIENLLHSYAISIHKSQGSEYKIVIIKLLMANVWMLNRQILYTGVTRAKQQVVLIGQQQALVEAVRTNRPAMRYTQLTDHLRESSEKSVVKQPAPVISPEQISIQGRIHQLKLTVSKGELTKIGSLSVKLFEERYGHRPSKKAEKVGGFSFNTYHYPANDIDLVDSAIQQVLGL